MRRQAVFLLSLLFGLSLSAHSQTKVNTSPIEVSPISGLPGAAPAIAPIGSSLQLAPLQSASLTPTLLPSPALPSVSAPALQAVSAKVAAVAPLKTAGTAAPASLALPKSVVAAQAGPSPAAAAPVRQDGQAEPQAEKPGVIGKLQTLSEKLDAGAQQQGRVSPARAEQGETLSKFWEHGSAANAVHAETHGEEAYPYPSGQASISAAARVIAELDSAIAPDGRARVVGVLVMKSGEILVGLSGKPESLGAPDFLEALAKVKARLGPGYTFVDLDSGLGRKAFAVPKNARGERVDNPFCAEKKLFKDFREGRRSLGDIAQMAVLWRGPGANDHAKHGGDPRLMVNCEHCLANAALIQGR